jgi:hypothetical protein
MQSFKQRQMTDTAFKKKREKTHKDFADVYTKAAYDMYPSEMIKKLKEKDNVLKEKDEILNRLIIRLYSQEQKTKESIADLIGLPVEIIDNIILKAKIN